jgi:hypothetical protein
MNIDSMVSNKIIQDAVLALDVSPLNILSYKSISATKTKQIRMKLAAGNSISTGIKKGVACVYAIYEIGTPSIIKYVGSSTNINTRLRQHLVTNKWALSDRTFLKKNGKTPTRSKLGNVYELLNIVTIKQIGYKVITVSPDSYYRAVELELINYYNLKKVGWNKTK